MQVSFSGYNSILKQYYKAGLLPSVKRGLYGDFLTRGNVCLEHIVPVSYGGDTTIFNLALTTKRTNNLRGNAPLQDFLEPRQAINYLLQFKDIRLPNFNGNNYITHLLDLFHKLKVFSKKIKKIKKNLRFRIDN